MNGFELRRKKKIDDILNVAFELLKTEGIKSANIKSIAEKAKVSQVSIYNFFGNKENLIRQAFFRFMDQEIEGFASIVKSELTFREKAKKMLSLSYESYNAINQDFINSAIENDPQVMKFLEEFGNTKAIPLCMELVEQGKQEGAIDKDLSPNAVLLFINAVNTALHTTTSAKERMDLGKLLYHGLFYNAKDE